MLISCSHPSVFLFSSLPTQHWSPSPCLVSSFLLCECLFPSHALAVSFVPDRSSRGPNLNWKDRVTFNIHQTHQVFPSTINFGAWLRHLWTQRSRHTCFWADLETLDTIIGPLHLAGLSIIQRKHSGLIERL
jgi:hypothetical protein